MPTDPGQPVSKAETDAARAAIDAAVADGSITSDEGRRRKEGVLHAVTPRDLWKASGGLAGDPTSGDPWSKHVRTGVLIFLGAVVAMVVVVYFTGVFFEIGPFD